jgi:FkbM family methyltransferase
LCNAKKFLLFQGIYAAKNGYNVILFEPFINQSKMIEKNFRLNNFENTNLCIVNENHLVSDKAGEFYAFEDDNKGGQRQLIKLSSNYSFNSVKSTSIDFILNREPFLLEKCIVHYLKIDSEGYEPNILVGAENSLKNSKIKSVLIEYTPFWSIKYLKHQSWAFLLDYVCDLFSEKPLVFVLHRTQAECFGPIQSKHFKEFHDEHVNRRMQTDVLFILDKEMKSIFMRVRPCTEWTPNMNVLA